MTRTPRTALIGAALLLGGCVAPPDQPTYAPPPAAHTAPPAAAAQPYVYAHTGHYFRGPYDRAR